MYFFNVISYAFYAIAILVIQGNRNGDTDWSSALHLNLVYLFIGILGYYVL